MHISPKQGNTGQAVAPASAGPGKLTRQVMSSREIAELTAKQHFHVKRDIEKMLVDLGEDPSKFGCTYLDGQNRKQSEYLLDREHTDCLLTGYSAELRMKVIRRWRELEGQVVGQLQIPSSFADALRLAADQAEENHNLRLTITQQQPKVEALDRLTATTGSLCITDAAKHIGIAPLKLFSWLSRNRWIYRRTSFANWSAFQPRLASGVLEHKLVEIKNQETKELKVVEQVMVTRRGLVLLAEKISGVAL